MHFSAGNATGIFLQNMKLQSGAFLHPLPKGISILDFDAENCRWKIVSFLSEKCQKEYFFKQWNHSQVCSFHCLVEDCCPRPILKFTSQNIAAFWVTNAMGIFGCLRTWNYKAHFLQYSHDNQHPRLWCEYCQEKILALKCYRDL